MSAADELLERARRRLHELEEADDELGERIELAPGEHFRGRYRGTVTMTSREGDAVEVVGLWDEDGRPRFHYKTTAIISELDALAPLEVHRAESGRRSWTQSAAATEGAAAVRAGGDRRDRRRARPGLRLAGRLRG